MWFIAVLIIVTLSSCYRWLLLRKKVVDIGLKIDVALFLVEVALVSFLYGVFEDDRILFLLLFVVGEYIAFRNFMFRKK